jgi:ATP-binding cassette subfamily C (CFTR/MRP) protein 1
LWELPKARLTSAITDDVETNFYMRCEPEKRPRFLRDKFQDTAPPEELDEEKGASDATAPPPEAFTRTWYGKKQAVKVEKPVYDASLLQALHKTFFMRIWFAGMLNLFSGA